jgi:hypothetical protein
MGFWWGFAIGLFVGVNVGVFGLALVVSGKFCRNYGRRYDDAL